MSIYLKIYENLCESKKSLESFYGPGSGLHKHHIIPKHSGGLDIESNFTYLTPREHTLAHFMLWKIHKNVNDLRSMKMLGANLSYAYRRIIGIWCRDNKLGYHDSEIKRIASERGMQSQKDSGRTDTFYWWSTPEGRSKRAQLGGLRGGKTSKKNKVGIFDESKRSEYAVLGGIATCKMPLWCNGYKNTRSYTSPGDDWFLGKILKTKNGSYAVYRVDFMKRTDQYTENNPKVRPVMWTNGIVNRRAHNQPENDFYRGITQRHCKTGEIVTYRFYNTTSLVAS